jgi:hypothetical protein
MNTAGVVLDAWKLPIFKKHLDAAGYKYEVRGELTKDVLMLAVSYEWVAKLKPIIESANKECANAKRT